MIAEQESEHNSQQGHHEHAPRGARSRVGALISRDDSTELDRWLRYICLCTTSQAMGTRLYDLCQGDTKAAQVMHSDS